MVSAAEAQQMRTAQAGLVSLATADLEEFFSSLDLDKPEVARNALISFLPMLILRYGMAGAALAADWYDQLRADEGVAGRYRAAPAEPVDINVRTEATVRRSMAPAFALTTASTVGLLYAGQPAGARAAGLVLPALTDPMTKMVLEPARETTVLSALADPQAAGWTRVTRAGSCKFCRMLASKGAVYKQRTVDFAAHGHCNCAAAPSWDKDGPEVDVRAYVASERLGNLRERAASDDPKVAGKAKAALERHTARVRTYLDGMDD